MADTLRLHDFGPEIDAVELPGQFTYPFHYTPHPLCKEATRLVQCHVEQQPQLMTELEQGKMLGVLVVMAPEARRPQFLAAFSGNLCGSNDIPYFVTPVYDLLKPNGVFKHDEAAITAINHRITALSQDPALVSLRGQLAQATQHGRMEIEQFKKHVAQAKAHRDAAREAGPVTPEDNERMLDESRFLKAELKRLRHRVDNDIAALRDAVTHCEEEIAQLKNQRKAMSEALQERIFRLFVVENARGDTSDLTTIFASALGKLPPAGAGECCAPKLLHYAYVNHLQPLCMAEFWYGASPVAEVRHHGHFYPACRSKCKPILDFMLQGLDVEQNSLAQPGSEPGIEVIYNDKWLTVVNKPAGLLSVPGKLLDDSALTRFQFQFPLAEGPMVVHRLDQETSGLLLFAKDKDTHKLLQAQFASRAVHKQYIALLDGDVLDDEGIIDLPLCPDVDDRPRQMVSEKMGKHAVTRYRVVDRRDGLTRMEFYPLTGRTHQLRVHSSHPLGLNAPIAGDPLYGSITTHDGTAVPRLMLHAHRLTFAHPATGETLTFHAPAPF